MEAELIENLQFDAAALLIDIQDVQGVSQKVVNNVVQKVNGLFDSFLGILCNRFQSKCGPHDALSHDEIFDILNGFLGQNIFEGVEKRLQLDAFIDKNEGLIRPEKVVFSWKEVTKKNSITRVPAEWGYYVPFLPSLEKALSCPEIMHCVKNPLPHTPGVFRTALDGAFYQNHPVLLKDKHALGIGIYSDAAEVTDSASTKSGLHGLTFIYWSLYNVHPKLRSTIRSIFLLGVVKASYLKKHGYEKILEDFVGGCNVLSSTGKTFNLNGYIEHIYGVFMTNSGDNPGSANVGGYKESSSFSNSPCRQCHVLQSEFYSSFKESSFELRTMASHLKQVEEVEAGQQGASVRYGVNGRSALMAINGCDVTKCLPQDFMHDCLEGTLKLDITCTLYHVLVVKKTLSFPELNQRIKMFSKFTGVNKPAAITMEHMNKFKLRLTAAEALNLAYILPFVLSKRVNGKLVSLCDDKNLKLLIMRLNLTDLQLSEEIYLTDLPKIRTLMEKHHILFDELYPERKLPKMHYELHNVTHILLFGPACRYWCMRYEAKHSFFKRRWRVYRSLKDHAGTLAMAHQRHQCGLMMLCHRENEPFLQDREYSCGVPVTKKLDSLPHKNVLRRAFPGLSENEAVQVFKVATIKGVKYTNQSAFVTSFSNYAPKFGKVVQILKVRESLVILYQKFFTLQYEKRVNSFKVKHTSEFSVYHAKDLAYNHKLHFLQFDGVCYIVVPCRSYLDVNDDDWVSS